ncbi:MAG: cation:proton antiporter [Kiloniellaceae bacterium]
MGDEMPEAGYLLEVIVILLAAVVGVLLFQRLRLGSILGYLVAGAVVGPTGLGLVAAVETTRALAALGVVFLLFTVGLELPFERIKVMRGSVFGLGAAQVILTGLAIGAAAVAAGQTVFAAGVIGAGLSLSSTAIVLGLLSERGQITTRVGRSAFAVLLVQDLAVAPFLVAVLALGQGEATALSALGIAALKMLIAVIALLGVGRIVLRHVFWPVAAIRDPEIFAAFTLLIVLCAGLLTRLAGLSMALGAFLAGMLLAETHYRHQVGAVIRPFRGLLLGLFFVTVGMSIDLELAVRQGWIIAALLVALLVGKAAILVILARLFGVAWAQALYLGILLAQGGEFAFVLLGAGMAGGVVPGAQGQLLLVVVGLSMVATPLLARLGAEVARRVERAEAVGVEETAAGVEALRDHIVIAGFGRVGGAVAARLEAAGVPFVAVDMDPHRIAQARQRGLPVYYGDITRPEILAALHVERARSLVVAIDDPKAAAQLVGLVCYIFPNLKVYARARDDAHARELQKLGAHTVVPELVETGFALAGSIIGAMDAAAEAPGASAEGGEDFAGSGRTKR